MKAKARRRAMAAGLAGIVLVGSLVLFAAAGVDEESSFIQAVEANDVGKVTTLLAKNGGLAQAEPRGKAGSTPILRDALLRGFDEIARQLVTHGATPDKYPGILIVARNVEIAEFLIQHGADVNGLDPYGRTALGFFASADNAPLAECLIDHGARVNAEDRQGETPLHAAAREGSLNAAKLLVSKGADIRARSRQNKTALDYAVMPIWNEDAYRMPPERIQKNKAVAAFLVSQGSPCTVFDLAWIGDIERLSKQLADDPSLTSAKANGESLLFAAVRGGSVEAVEYFLTHGAQLDVKGRFQQTPLQVAAYAGCTGVLTALLDHGAPVDEKGRWGETSLHWAAFRGNTDVAAILLKRGANPNAQTTAHTVDLNVIAKETDPVQRELAWFATLEEQRRSGAQVMVLSRLAFCTGDTPILVAAYWNHPEIVKLLAANGADVRLTNRWGATALHLAAVCRYADVTQVLLDAGSDPEAKTKDGLTAIDLAEQVKDQQLVKLLTKRPSR